MSEIIVFVVHSMTASEDWGDLAERALRARYPRWCIDHAESRPLRIGLYDTTPVVIYHSAHPEVVQESAEMADGLLRAGNDLATVARTRQADKRFEVTWDLADDPDLVPETAEMLLNAAQVLVAICDGVALHGQRLIRFGGDLGDAVAQLLA